MWVRVPGACAPEFMVSSLVAPPKPLKNPLVSNEATASPVGPNGQKLSFFYGSSLLGTPTAANDMPCCSILLPGGRSLAVRTAGLSDPWLAQFALPLLPSCCCSVRHVSSLCMLDLWNEHHIGLPSPPALLFPAP